MKKNLFLLTLLTPTIVGLLPVCSSCGSSNITNDSVHWDFVKDGSYKSRVEAKQASEPVKQEDATKLYLDDVKNNHFIFVDDYMVYVDSLYYIASSYGLKLNRGLVDIEFKGIDEDYFVSYCLNLDIEVQQNGQVVFAIKFNLDVSHLQFCAQYYDSDWTPIKSSVPLWAFMPYATEVSQTPNDNYNLTRQYFDTIKEQGKQWSIKGNYETYDIDIGKKNASFDINNDNYATVDAEEMELAFSISLTKQYSHYFAEVPIKEDFLFDKGTIREVYSGEEHYALEPTEFSGSIELGKHYIFKIDVSKYSGMWNPEIVRLNIDYDDQYDELFQRVSGLTFVTINKTKTIIPRGHGCMKPYISTDVELIKPTDIIYTDFWVDPVNYGKTMPLKYLFITFVRSR